MSHHDMEILYIPNTLACRKYPHMDRQCSIKHIGGGCEEAERREGKAFFSRDVRSIFILPHTATVHGEVVKALRSS